MAKESINAGGVVYLKSGGPPMTVSSVGEILGQPMVSVHWFEGTKMHRENVAPDALTKTKPESIGGYP